MKNIYIHILWWFAFPFIGIINGALRELTYKKLVGDLPAHQISTVIGIILFGIIFCFIFKKWKIESLQNAILLGFIWLFLTILFGFGFGHYIMGRSWAKLFHDYNLSEGMVWSLFLAWVSVAPYFFFRIFNKSKV